MPDQPPLLDRLAIRHPIIQAPMAGGATTPALVAAVSEAGGLGMLGAGLMAPAAIAQAIAEIRRLTSRPFGVNLFVPEVKPAERDGPAIDAMIAVLAPWYAELRTEAPPRPVPPPPDFEAQAEVILAARVDVFSFTFGVPDAVLLRAFRDGGAVVIGTATTVAEGLILTEAGVDAVVAQGSEAGGHRGTFAGPFEPALVGTMALVPQMAAVLELPVIAAGGIMDGRGIAAARVLGAAAVQLGTAFLATMESGIHPMYKQELLNATDDATAVTRAFTGRPARGIRNPLMATIEQAGTPIPDYPVQAALTAPIRRAATRWGRTDAMALWAGQGAGRARALPAAALMEALVKEAADATPTAIGRSA
ncbi:MAG: nitronate monooxygenase [Rhodospirillales bacterium]|nr:MAG: nitronate monooxygenase [Rhodospirillales bacterium]